MKIVTEIREANKLLKNKYLGMNAQIWLFGISHKRLALRLKRTEKDSQVVYIVGVNCDYISGPFSWENSNLLISENNTDNLSGTETHITDNIVGFKLTTSGGFALAEGNETEFGNSFEDFLLEK